MERTKKGHDGSTSEMAWMVAAPGPSELLPRGVFFVPCFVPFVTSFVFP
jgi:hypothetical protein